MPDDFKGTPKHVYISDSKFINNSAVDFYREDFLEMENGNGGGFLFVSGKDGDTVAIHNVVCSKNKNLNLFFCFFFCFVLIGGFRRNDF